jgi:23S rRNA (uracil1939-C5)-methyltransferase
MELRIDRLGGRGDGIADGAEGAVYVPLAAPGDVVEAKIVGRRGDASLARIDLILEAGPHRRAPDCPHFGACGGCALQHLEARFYGRWKSDRVATALAQHGLDPDIAPLVSVPPGTRRRVRVAFRRTAGGTVLGFREAAGKRIVNAESCPVACPEIVAAFPALRDFLQAHAASGEVALTLTDTGLDTTVWADREPDLDLRLDAPAFCEANGIVRLNWAREGDAPEPVIALQAAEMSWGGRTVVLPPDAFVQPTEAGEAVLTDFVLAAAGEAAHVADLYAGCGAFSLPLAASGKHVRSIEGLASQTAALHRADPYVETETRDLARQPLRAEELQGVDTVVLDPPRAGAAPQIAELAGSAVARVVYVSCNPATFARDARTLVDGGYRLERVQPVDQFLWSPHVELASVFTRA